MSPTRFIWQSLKFHRFTYAGVLAGAVLGATVLLGALFSGDSVAESLRQISQQRIGRATHAILAGDRFFRQALAADLAQRTGARTAPLLYARGSATQPTSRATSPQVQIVGVTDAFWSLAPTPPALQLEARAPSFAINTTLARRLHLALGDPLVLRLQKPGILAGNAPVAGAEASLQALRGTVAAILDESAFGRFNLEATQVATPTVFLPIGALQASLEQPGLANLLLVEDSAAKTDLAKALNAAVTLADYGLSLKWLEQAATFEIASNRIFIDPALATAINGALPNAQPAVSYLVNEFRIGDRKTPYSIATATTAAAAPFLPADLGPREIVLNDWLAADLQAKIGDEVSVAYFQVGAGSALIEARTPFRVRAIVPLQGLAADRAWMPDFPGMSDAKSTSEWNPGLPLKLDLIRSQDERYWETHRGTPKAFLSPEGGRDIWSSRWGTFTAMRVALPREREAELTATLLRALRPEMNQLVLRKIRADAQAAANSAVDFGGLFAGMSFFLILAALGLVAMLFQFCLLQRNREEALLGAVGVPPQKLFRWRLTEGVGLLFVGSLLALPLATLYTRGILRFLETIWAEPGATATFVFAASPVSIIAGTTIFFALSLIGMGWATRKQARSAQLSIRLAAHTLEISPTAKAQRASLIVAATSSGGAALAIAMAGRGLPAQAAFYLAGAALLTAGIAFCRAILTRPASLQPSRPFDADYLGKLNLTSRYSRSLTVVGLIATAVFMVLSVASFRKHTGNDWRQPTSGTGGFTFWLETTSALNLARDGRATGFEVFDGVTAELGDIFTLRRGTGDNASCFNLNSTDQPRLLAVDAGRLATRQAFRPKIPASAGANGGWPALQTLGPDGAIPVLVDETTLLWALKRKVGDRLAYTSESGVPFEVRIVGTLADSIFQGHLLMDERLFLSKFPSHAGYSIFLIDAKNTANLEALRTSLEAATRDSGGRVSLTREILAAFHEIENTYIAIFNVLGSLGVLLGSLGLTIVIARNLHERRGEFAVMTAMGIPRDAIGRMVFAEFGRLVIWGLTIGTLASAVAIWPSVTSLPAIPTLALVTTLLCGILGLNLTCGWLIFRWSLRELRAGLAQSAF